MEFTSFWLSLFVLLLLGIGVMIFIGIGLLAGYVASWLGFSGLMWWAVTLVFYVVIGGFIAMIYRLGSD